MDILQILTKHFPLQREDIGIAWLKDKIWITKQRLSLSKRKIKMCGGIQAVTTLLSQTVKILNTTWHTEPLAVGKNKGNLFHIRLRNRSSLTPQQVTTLENEIEKIKKIWFPNAFGIQRFWKGNKNFKKASKIFEQWKKFNLGYEVKFKLQAYGSMRFNEYVMKREEEWAFLLDGDIMINGMNAFGTQVAEYQNNKLYHFDYRKLKTESSVHKPHLPSKIKEQKDFLEPEEFLRTSDHTPQLWFPTGPVLWAEQLLCRTGSNARTYDDWLLSESRFSDYGKDISDFYHLYGFRRALWVIPQDFRYEREEKDLILTFWLPTWSYASVCLAWLLRNIDPQGCVSNGLIIPRK